MHRAKTAFQYSSRLANYQQTNKTRTFRRTKYSPRLIFFKCTAKIILIREKLEALLLRLEIRQRCRLSSLFPHGLGIDFCPFVFFQVC